MILKRVKAEEEIQQKQKTSPTLFRGHNSKVSPTLVTENIKSYDKRTLSLIGVKINNKLELCFVQLGPFNSLQTFLHHGIKPPKFICMFSEIF